MHSTTAPSAGRGWGSEAPLAARPTTAAVLPERLRGATHQPPTARAVPGEAVVRRDARTTHQEHGRILVLAVTDRAGIWRQDMRGQKTIEVLLGWIAAEKVGP